MSIHTRSAAQVSGEGRAAGEGVGSGQHFIINRRRTQINADNGNYGLKYRFNGMN